MVAHLSPSLAINASTAQAPLSVRCLIGAQGLAEAKMRRQREHSSYVATAN